MATKKYNPTSPGRRFGTRRDMSAVTAQKPEKSLLRPVRKKGGRNSKGTITCRHRGGGHKRQFRLIDFRRDKDGIPAKVASIEYDPNRSANIALLNYVDGEKRYILAPLGLEVGDMIESGENAAPKIGNCMPLRNVPPGLTVYAVEMVPGKGAQLARSAGTTIQLAAKEGKFAHLNLPSGEVRKVLLDCRATIGQVGNLQHSALVIGKAGRKRWMGRRPHVRGSAMNPVSHPLGGGEGRTGAGRDPCSPTGVLAKGGKTRKKHKPSNKFIIRRRKRKRG